MTTVVAENGALDIDSAADLLAGAETDDAREEEEAIEEIEAEDAEGQNEASEGDEPDTEDEIAAAEDAGTEPVVEDATPAPASWSKEEGEVWKTLKPEARAIIAKREADRDRATAEAVQKTGQFGAQLKKINDQYQEYLPIFTDGFEARWGKIDWVALAKETTAEEYNEIRAQMEEERKQLDAYKVKAKEAADTAYAAFLSEEMPKLERLVPEIAKPGEPRNKLLKYVGDLGYGPDDIKHASAVELSIAWKAMKYDEAYARAKERVKGGKKPGEAAPKAVKSQPTGAAPNSKQAEVKALQNRVAQTRSIDDAARLLVAREERTARRR